MSDQQDKRHYGQPKGLDWGFQMHPVVFPVSALVIVGFVVLGVIFTEPMKGTLEVTQRVIAEYADWLYILCLNFFLGFSVYLLFSRFGAIRIGGPEATPDFSRWGWFSMLFSAGTGVGLLFYCVAEPMLYYWAPPMGEAESAQAAKDAMASAFFHWGPHVWALYALVGLSLGYFGFTRGLPLTIRSSFYPLLGERVDGALGNLVDALAVVATLFGVATSLGLGAQQVNAGLLHIFGIPKSVAVQVVLIGVITGIATFSVLLGLDKGIQRLSKTNVWLAAALLVFVLIFGPTVFVLGSIAENIGYFLQQFPALSTWNETYQGSRWQNQWTIFYFSWWIAWSPFVGMFIARISRGRTVREYLLGVIIVPTLITFVWLSIFAGAALYQELFGYAHIAQASVNDLSASLFVLLESMPLATVSSLVAVVLVTIFFATSSDSGSFVIDIITSGGDPNPPKMQRLFWALLEGTVAAVLLVVGGIVAFESVAIAAGFPFTIVIVVMCLGLLKAFQAHVPRAGQTRSASS